jgi:copper chaperone NosL
MTPLIRILTMLAMIAGGACGGQSDGPPRIEVDRTSCAHCGMLISERGFAAAYRSPGSNARVFDDIACLLEGVATEGDRSNTRFWFHDLASSEWIEGAGAVFVHSARLRTPMAGGFVAYSDAAAAERGAVEHQGRVIRSLGDLFTEGPDGR